MEPDLPRSTKGIDASGGITPAVLEQLDGLADQSAVNHYRNVLREVRQRHMEPFVTLNHFSLPLWIHHPIAARDAFSRVLWDDPVPQGFGPSGWVGDDIVPEFAKYSAYLAWKFGDLVDTWTPINEPMVVAVTGYVNSARGEFPPAAFSFTGRSLPRFRTC